MAWVRLDDVIAEHPKIVRAGPLASWLHVAAIAYCNRWQTDGRIPRRAVPMLVGWEGISVKVREGRLHSVHEDVTAAMLVEVLLREELWHETEDGDFEVHDYLEYQPSRAQVHSLKEARSKGGRQRAQLGAEQDADNELSSKPAGSSAGRPAQSPPKPKPVPKEAEG